MSNPSYTTTDIDRAVELLQRYHVSYIYIGRLENLYYAGDGLEKFKQDNEHWSVVYQNEEVTILQVH